MLQEQQTYNDRLEIRYIPLLPATPPPIIMPQVDAQAVIDRMEWTALDVADQHNAPVANVQEWCKGVYINLTMFRVFTHVEVVWTVGIPQPGMEMDVVNETQQAIVLLEAALKEVQA